MLNVERFLWPGKFSDLVLPVFIIPIQAQWAMDLFDEKLAQQRIIGANIQTALNYENVYYRSKKALTMIAPARILWYISYNKNVYGSKMLRAASYLDDISINSPEKLFNSFGRLGVYQLKDLQSISLKSKMETLMAIKFSSTELFSNPISLSELKEIYYKHEEKKLILQSPVSASHTCFVEIYKKGIN